MKRLDYTLQQISAMPPAQQHTAITSIVTDAERSGVLSRLRDNIRRFLATAAPLAPQQHPLPDDPYGNLEELIGTYNKLAEVGFVKPRETKRLTTGSHPNDLIKEVNSLREQLSSRLNKKMSSISPIGVVSKDPFAMILRSSS